MSRTVEGGVALDGRLDVLGGETVLTALAALSAPGGADDDRSTEQRHADALVTLARQALDQGELPIVGGVRPHVTVVVPLETIQAARTPETGGNTDTGGNAEEGAGWAGQADLRLDTEAADPGAGAAGRGIAGAAGRAATPGQPRPALGPGAGVNGEPARLDRLGTISGQAARMLACDAGIVRVITAGASQPLDVGRETRVVSPAQRRALAVRDGGCVGCRAPVGWCEAHHVLHWLDWGVTNLDNLVLVCWACHRDIHDRGWRPVCGPDGHWTLHPPHPQDPPPASHRGNTSADQQPTTVAQPGPSPHGDH